MDGSTANLPMMAEVMAEVCDISLEEAELPRLPFLSISSRYVYNTLTAKKIQAKGYARCFHMAEVMAEVCDISLEEAENLTSCQKTPLA